MYPDLTVFEIPSSPSSTNTNFQYVLHLEIGQNNPLALPVPSPRMLRSPINHAEQRDYHVSTEKKSEAPDNLLFWYLVHMRTLEHQVTILIFGFELRSAGIQLTLRRRVSGALVRRSHGRRHSCRLRCRWSASSNIHTNTGKDRSC